MDAEKFSPIVPELIGTHAERCCFHKSNYIYWNRWLDHFYREESTLNVTNIGELAAFLAF